MLGTAAKIRIARVLYWGLHALRRLSGGHDQVRVRRNGVNWDLDLREGIDLTIYCLGAFERQTLRELEALVPEGATVLDIGANIGAHTLHLARFVGGKGRVLAFEPTDFAMAKLRANLQANPGLATRVEVHQSFLGSGAGAKMAASLASSWPVDGTIPDDKVMGSRGMSVSGATATTVDAAVASAGDPPVRLIKLDVDGHELEVLMGARGLLQTRKPVIVMELAPYVFEPADKFDQMIELLGQLGYSFRRLRSSRTLPSSPAALRRLIPRTGSINVVAFPAASPP